MLRLSLLFVFACSLSLAAQAQTETPPMPAESVEVAVADSTETTIQPDPEKAKDLYREGLEAYRADDLDAALLKYEEALLYDEAYAPAGLGRAQVLTRMDRLEDARSAFEETVAMSQGFEAANASQLRSAARTGLQQINDAIAARATAAEQNAAASEMSNNVTRATDILGGTDLSPEQATEGLALLEQVVANGYEADQLAFYFAKALITLDRGADAVPYAQTALEASEGEADRSGFYIQLGLAHMKAGNDADARSAFGSIAEGQSWHGWAVHYLGQLDAEG